MTTLSVIIVNYNVKYFLARCIESIMASVTDYKIEIIVIDNASKDNSREYILSKYGTVNYIYNVENIGFSKANNIGISKATGEYILILNPDTIIAEDTIDKGINYLKKNPDIGALGPKMIDGSGQFLKESKRSKPTGWNAFCKFSGLAELFPKTKLFDSYNLGYYHEDSVATIDVLCGAFIMTSRKILEEIGSFDESYFMYGEDIDLSNKINKLGYKTVYNPMTTIIHFKGESSKKTSISYSKHFYNAMLIYINRNATGFRSMSTKTLLKFAILFVGTGSFIKQNILKKWPLVLDAIILCVAFSYLRNWWGETIFGNKNYFNNSASIYNSLGAVIIWIMSIWVMGHYDNKWNPGKLRWGITSGTIIILVIYSLLPSHMRSSRAMIILGTVPLGIITYLTHIARKKADQVVNTNYKNKYLLSGEENQKSVMENLIENKIENTVLNPSIKEVEESEYIILDSATYTNKRIIDLVGTLLKNKKILISGGENSYIVYSENSYNQGEVVNAFSFAKLGESYCQRLKRIFDILFTLYLFVLYPFQKAEIRQLISTTSFLVLFGQKTWIGYSMQGSHLPRIKKGIFNTQKIIKSEIIYPEILSADIADNYYAMNYSILLDYRIITQNLKDYGDK